MDQALRTALRAYLAQPTDAHAHQVIRLYLKTLGVLPALDIPHKNHGYLTYAGLLHELLQLSDDQLAATVTEYNAEVDEFHGMTAVHMVKNTDVLDAGQPVIARHSCRRCTAPLGQPEISDFFAALDNEGVGPPGHQVFGDVALSRASHCQNCVYCVECSPVLHDPNYPHQCPLVPGCPCCDFTMTTPG